jgi:F-type H+-transporting ATPase subunit b
MADKKTALAVLLLAPLFLFMTNEEGAEAAGGSGLLGKVINFVLLFGGLVMILRKPLREFLRKRTEAIRAQMKDAQTARLEAEAKLDEARRKIADLEVEVIRMKEDAEAGGLKDKERIRALAAKEESRIRSFAEQEIDLQLKAGIRELKEYTAELAASLAEARIKDKITAGEQSALIDRSINQLAELHEKSSSG